MGFALEARHQYAVQCEYQCLELNFAADLMDVQLQVPRSPALQSVSLARGPTRRCSP